MQVLACKSDSTRNATAGNRVRRYPVAGAQAYASENGSRAGRIWRDGEFSHTVTSSSRPITVRDTRPDASSLGAVTVERDLGPGEWSVLALLADARPRLGAREADVAGRGEIGRVWSMGRPLVYRALELLEARGLIEAVGSEPGARGPNRALFSATDEGREELQRWLSEPVDHVRDVRSLFLLKLVLIERAGLESTPLLEAQRALSSCRRSPRSRRGSGSSVGTEQVFVRFRLETTRAVVYFIDGMLAEDRQPARAASTPPRRR